MAPKNTDKSWGKNRSRSKRNISNDAESYLRLV